MNPQWRRLRRLLPILLTALSTLWLPPLMPGVAEADPQSAPWVGTWAFPACTEDAVTIVLERSKIDLSTFEAVCTIRRVRKRGTTFDIDAACDGEGGRRRANFSVRVDGDTLRFVRQTGFEFDPKHFTRCRAPQRGQVDSPANSAPAVPSSPGLAEKLPLMLGFYVSSDTPCGMASNATLQLLRRSGIGGGRMLCSIEEAEKIGAKRYRVREYCRDLTGQDSPITLRGVYAIESPTAFVWRSDDGYVNRARHCPQPSLPAPWRDNDVTDLFRQ